MARAEMETTIEKGAMGVGEGSMYVGVGGRGGGRGKGGQLTSRDELFVNFFWSYSSFLFFIHRVLVTWYFKNRCVNCVFTHVQL